jgi:hypothetical protein
VSLPTLTDLKAHLNLDTTADDGELADMLDAAVDVVEGIVGPITSKTVTETHHGCRRMCWCCAGCRWRICCRSATGPVPRPRICC